MGQKRVHKLIKYMIQWLKDSEKKEQIGSIDTIAKAHYCKWMFCFLSMLEDPLQSNMLANLAELRKILNRVRNRIKKYTEVKEDQPQVDLTPEIDLVIVIIEDIYDQKERLY
eukprot:TRINITY_DN4532_c0_g1_i1.p1 TRINITY_DN4532_c0_g1~~TRINITY_DN4532_c0_g1_i1.p1  ORF type:complete len:112 (-),score=26.84 TRINITY_DN4532_c0_g1_i1:7-342(-)